jgi:hypothetical protein
MTFPRDIVLTSSIASAALVPEKVMPPLMTPPEARSRKPLVPIVALVSVPPELTIRLPEMKSFVSEPSSVSKPPTWICVPLACAPLATSRLPPDEITTPLIAPPDSTVSTPSICRLLADAPAPISTEPETTPPLTKPPLNALTVPITAALSTVPPLTKRVPPPATSVPLATAPE